MEENKASPRRVHNLKIQLAGGQISDSKLVAFTNFASESSAGATCLELMIDNVGRFYKQSNNYFDALIALRMELEPLGIKLLCFGARKDVWASGMQRDMDAGMRAYLLSAHGEGRKPERSIFEFAVPESIGTVLEQREYADAWLNLRGQ